MEEKGYRSKIMTAVIVAALLGLIILGVCLSARRDGAWNKPAPTATVEATVEPFGPPTPGEVEE